MQLLESLLRRSNQSKSVHENVQSNQADIAVNQEVPSIAPVVKLIDKETHLLRFKEGFEEYADDWNEYASSVRLSLQGKIVEIETRLEELGLKKEEDDQKNSKAREEIGLIGLQIEELRSMNGPRTKKDKKNLKRFNKERGRRKNEIDNCLRNDNVALNRAREQYLSAAEDLIRADEEFATDLDVNRLVFYCYCNSIIDQEEINRLAVMLGSKRNLGRDDFLDLNLRLPRPLSSSDNLEERFRRVKELTNAQMRMINS